MDPKESFVKLKQHLSANGYLTEEALGSQGVEGMSQNDVKQTLDQMITRGLVIWKKPILDSAGRVQIQGRWALTPKGRTVL